MNFDIVGIGNALVDIQTQVSDALLSELNYHKGGMTLNSPGGQLELLQKLKDHSLSISSGGSAANTIHGLGALGARAYYIGKVANDNFGHHYTRDMAHCQVGFPGPDAEPEGTGTSVVLITSDAQRTMVTHLGISSALHPDNVDETILRGARYVYIEGYLWTGENTRQAAIKVAEYARSQGIPVAFTLSDAFVVNNHRAELLDFINWYVDILFCNEVEGQALAQSTDSEQAFTTIAGMCDILFFTRSAHGAWALHKGGEKVAVRTFPVQAVDTTGAGDLFAAGALYGLLHKMSMEEAAILGSYCASQVITHLGARLPAHAHKNVEKILTEYRSLPQ